MINNLHSIRWTVRIRSRWQNQSSLVWTDSFEDLELEDGLRKRRRMVVDVLHFHGHSDDPEELHRLNRHIDLDRAHCRTGETKAFSVDSRPRPHETCGGVQWEQGSLNLTPWFEVTKAQWKRRFAVVQAFNVWVLPDVPDESAWVCLLLDAVIQVDDRKGCSIQLSLVESMMALRKGFIGRRLGRKHPSLGWSYAGVLSCQQRKYEEKNNWPSAEDESADAETTGNITCPPETVSDNNNNNNNLVTERGHLSFDLRYLFTSLFLCPFFNHHSY